MNKGQLTDSHSTISLSTYRELPPLGEHIACQGFSGITPHKMGNFTRKCRVPRREPTIFACLHPLIACFFMSDRKIRSRRQGKTSAGVQAGHHDEIVTSVGLPRSRSAQSSRGTARSPSTGGYRDPVTWAASEILHNSMQGV